MADYKAIIKANEASWSSALAGMADDLNTWANESQFQGFDYEKMWNHLLVTKANNDADLLKKNVVKALVWWAKRGTNITKGAEKSSDAGKTLINSLQNFFGFVKKEGGRYTPTDVTVGRLVAMFPVLAANIMRKLNVSPLGSVPTGFPRFGCFASAPALIPTELWASDSSNVRQQYIKWAVSFDKAIKPGTLGKVTDEERETQILRYANSINTSGLYDDTDRTGIWNQIVAMSAPAGISASPQI